MHPIFKRRIVTIARIGDLHIREPSAAATIKLVQLGKRQAAGEPVEEDLLRMVIKAGVINPDGKPMFDDKADPLEIWPMMEAAKVAEEVQKVLTGGDSPNSEATPSDS